MELRPATRDSLGAVIIGEGFEIAEDGMLTIDENSIKRDEYAEFTKKELKDLFEKSKARRR